MKKITLAVWALLATTMFAAGSMFAACGSSTSTPLGPPGTSGKAGSGAAGTGAAGTHGGAGAGAAGTGVAGTGAAGTTGVAGTGAAGTGVAGTGAAGTGVAGTVGAGGTGSGPGVAGASGQAGSGAAGTGAVGSCSGRVYPATTADGRCVAGAFKRSNGICTCQPDNPLICSAGCTNTDMDDDNCGCCDNKCGPTSTCIAAACGPVPTTVVPGVAGCTTTVGILDLGLSLAISGTTMYVADAGHGTVKSYPLAGGAATTIAMGEMAPHAITVAGSTVVWISSVAGPKGDGGLPVVFAALRKAEAAGAAATSLVTANNEGGGIQGVVLSADGATAYYSSGAAINSIVTSGGAPTNIGNEDHGGLPGALALDGTKLAYPTYLNGDIDIMTIQAGKVGSCGKINPATGELEPGLQINCLRVARSQGSLVMTTVLARANRVYWADGTNLKANDTGPNAVQANDNIAQSPQSDIKAMAMSADKIYFVHDDVVERTPMVKDSTSVRIARGQKAPASVAVGATKVYWGNNGDCSVASTNL